MLREEVIVDALVSAVGPGAVGGGVEAASPRGVRAEAVPAGAAAARGQRRRALVAHRPNGANFHLVL